MHVKSEVARDTWQRILHSETVRVLEPESRVQKRFVGTCKQEPTTELTNKYDRLTDWDWTRKSIFLFLVGLGRFSAQLGPGTVTNGSGLEDAA